MTNSDPAKTKPSAPPSDFERVKAASNFLRGGIVEGLADPITGAISDDDNKLLKFHGSYLQDDRDLRDERRKQKLEPAFSFMLRARLPSGVVTPAQWLVFDQIAREHANGTLRITTRQTFQWHGIIKRNLKPTIAAIHASLAGTIAACGDVVRNVVSTANPIESAAHAEAYALATMLSNELAPKTRAYPVRCTCALRSSSLTIKSSASRMNCVMASVSLAPGSAPRSIACVAYSRAQFQPMPRL